MWLTQILLGLDYLHQNEIVHKDLKPENILFSKEKIKLCDFGTSSILDSNKYTKNNLGTIGYMSPETLNETKQEFSTDIWSLGCILHELCCLEVSV